jgi:hypothetical protein
MGGQRETICRVQKWQDLWQSAKSVAGLIFRWTPDESSTLRLGWTRPGWKPYCLRTIPAERLQALILFAEFVRITPALGGEIRVEICQICKESQEEGAKPIPCPKSKLGRSFESVRKES